MAFKYQNADEFEESVAMGQRQITSILFDALNHCRFSLCSKKSSLFKVAENSMIATSENLASKAPKIMYISLLNVTTFSNSMLKLQILKMEWWQKLSAWTGYEQWLTAITFAFHKILAWGWWRTIPLIWMSPVAYCFEHRATPSRKLTRGTGTRSLLLFGTFCFTYQTKHLTE